VNNRARPDAFRHTPRKRFGQNFLHDETVIERIIDSIDPQPQDHVVEIGPGKGALTRHLLHKCGRLDTIELDRDLVDYLARTLQQEKYFHIHQGDALKFDLSQLTDQPRSLRIVGNLPYNISTPVIFHLLRQQTLIKDMTFMLQLEVVNRLAAGLGDNNYGRLGLMAQYFCKVEHLFNVPSAAFTPKPKVSSAIVRLTPHDNPPVTVKDVECLQNVIRTAFTQRRKTLRNSLRSLVPEETLQQLSLDLTLRPENLSLADYARIADSIAGQPVGN
jgi:16S rRNA (adenine1518-N6/adenine1519-N6)-dimethyltransferase